MVTLPMPLSFRENCQRWISWKHIANIHSTEYWWSLWRQSTLTSLLYLFKNLHFFLSIKNNSRVIKVRDDPNYQLIQLGFWPFEWIGVRDGSKRNQQDPVQFRFQISGNIFLSLSFYQKKKKKIAHKFNKRSCTIRKFQDIQKSDNKKWNPNNN